MGAGRARRGALRAAGALAAWFVAAASAQTAAPPAGTPSARPEPPVAAQDSPAPPSPWRFDAVYKLDLLRLDRPRLGTGVGHLDVALNVDAATWLAVPATTLRLQAISDQGGQPNARLGSAGGITNLEVEKRSARLYAAWLSTQIVAGWNLLAGLYDLNSEFYVTDASALLVHPSFGIGTELAQTGRNGPSIFPNLSLGARLRMQGSAGRYAQLAVLDGVPGDPDHRGRAVVPLSTRDGARAVAAAGARAATAGSHWGAGVWSYTRAAARADGDGVPASRGTYVLAQGVILGGPAARTSAFFRAGIANRSLDAVDVAGEAGLLVERPFGAAGPAAATVGVADAHFSRRRAPSGLVPAGARAGHETVLEAGVRWRIFRRWVVQPLWQQVWRPGGRPGATATVVGCRIEWALASSAP